MAFFVVLRRSGPQYDAGRPLEEQSGWAEHAAFMDGLVAGGRIDIDRSGGGGAQVSLVLPLARHRI